MSSLHVNADRFTTTAALVKELSVLLQESDCKVIVLASPASWDRIISELEDKKLSGRVKIVGLQEDEPCNIQDE